jgi:hypothetical protein
MVVLDKVAVKKMQAVFNALLERKPRVAITEYVVFYEQEGLLTVRGVSFADQLTGGVSLDLSAVVRDMDSKARQYLVPWDVLKRAGGLLRVQYDPRESTVRIENEKLWVQTFPVPPMDDFPNEPEVRKENSDPVLSISLDAISSVNDWLFISDSSKKMQGLRARPDFATGVMVESLGRQIHYVQTDGHRMVVVADENSYAFSEDMECIIPNQAWVVLAANGEDGLLYRNKDDASLRVFVSEHTRFTFERVDSSLVSWRRALPDDKMLIYVAQIEGKPFMDILKAFAPAEFITLEFDSGGAHLNVFAGAQMATTALYGNASLTVRVNRAYLLNAISTILKRKRYGTIVMRFESEHQAFKIDALQYGVTYIQMSYPKED